MTPPGPRENGPATVVLVEDLAWFGASFADLADPEVMRQAWESAAG
jgi:hypothetical protein